MLRVLVLSVLLACCAVDAAPARVSVDTSLDLPWFSYEGDSHFEFGEALGKQFRVEINDRLRLSSQLQGVLLPFYATPLGKSTYDKYLSAHNHTFPDYVEELQGISAGSGVPFSTLFLINIVEEYGNSIPLPNAFESQLHCSDLVLHTSDVCVVGHNEDSGAGDVNRTALVTAKIKNNPWFTAFTYLGDLPTGAFGANQHGVAFSMNYVEPLDIDVGGLGRGFISRDLLGATSHDDAVARITRPGQASGHNFQLMDVPTARVLNIEVASFNRTNIREITAGSAPFFHTNQYQSLLIRQPVFPSSYHRLRRYTHVTPPSSVASILALLGDQGDTSYPIFHDDKSHAKGELSNWTLITVLFDVKNGVLYLLRPRVNPGEARVAMVVDLLDVQHVKLLHTASEQDLAKTNMLATTKARS
ncbi:hypothetical protein H257_00737 [Aphanomyces astaci]|uniref:Peptidase C45 hydrolase domain-containing protein n=2 Tax=Aphanomyces astaci TaxID=112090 RepID=W4HD03_APHAT|nr:hypothetical protein H257_00737 [Aphanomyces astaci]ETV89466.1 hypothetical protein H257_00737 [Aphanomyces astaci]|eukprot:XP_009821866.1 hypothetical protein H257_00737 [Aphanomyces astaci]